MLNLLWFLSQLGSLVSAHFQCDEITLPARSSLTLTLDARASADMSLPARATSELTLEAQL